MNNLAGMLLGAEALPTITVRAPAIGMLAPWNGRSVGVGGTGLSVDLETGLGMRNLDADADSTTCDNHCVSVLAAAFDARGAAFIVRQ